MNEKYDQARDIATKLFENTEYKKQADQLIASCDSALKWITTPTNVEVNNLKKVNSEYSEIAPAFYKNGIVFCTTREKHLIKKKIGVSEEPFYNLYYAWSDTNQVWHTNVFSIFLNTTDHEGPVTFTRDFNNIFLTRCKGNQTRFDSLNTNHLKLYKADKRKPSVKYIFPVGIFAFIFGS